MERYILGTEILKGMGLGNQLFVYISTRCLAQRNGMDFAVLGRDILEGGLQIGGKPFLGIDYGRKALREDFDSTLDEKDERIYIGDSLHDLTHGCYVSGTDERLFWVSGRHQNILLHGNLQAADYLKGYEDRIRAWLPVNPALDHREHTGDNVCVINIRGGEYAGNPELFLGRKYWIDCIRYMKSVRADMKFIVITDDREAAARVLPEVEAFHGDLAHDYTSIRNAAYLILSNSTFACFPAFTGNAKLILAPKYWARHNTSDGFWSSEQNIYPGFTYMDREGKLSTAEECIRELARYREETDFASRIGVELTGADLEAAKKDAERLQKKSMRQRALFSIKRRLHLYRREV